MMHASFSRTCSNPVTVAAMIRIHGLQAVLQAGHAPRAVIEAVRGDDLSLRQSIAERGLADAGRVRDVRAARRYGPACLAAQAASPYGVRLVAALVDAWAGVTEAGEIARRHGYDVADRVRWFDRDEIYAHAVMMGIDLKTLHTDPACLRGRRQGVVAQDVSLVARKLKASQRIIRRTCALFNVTRQDLASNNRRRDFVMARQFYAYWAKRLAGMSYPEIGRRLGGRDHTTALHSVRAWPDKRGEARAWMDARRRGAMSRAERRAQAGPRLVAYAGRERAA